MPSRTLNVYFVADQFSDSNRDEVSNYPGGAELTDQAIIESCPHTISTDSFATFTKSKLDQADVCVVGNSGTASREHIALLAESGKTVLFEHDLRTCRYRGNFSAPNRHLHNKLALCLCRIRHLKPLYDNSLGVIYLTALQRKMYRKNPFYSEPRYMVLGCSVFSRSFFERVERYQRNSTTSKDGVAVSFSKHPQKGFDLALEKARELSRDPVVIKDLAPHEVHDVLERCGTFIHLPRGVEPCGRMPIEARFLGNKVITNKLVGASQEDWWSMNDEDALEFVKGAASRFWTEVGNMLTS